MLIYFDQEHHSVLNNPYKPMGRHHPWSETVNTAGGRYVDFKNSPNLIPATLEDLQYANGSAAEGAIIDFITWANGPNSIYETNDFGLRPLKENKSGISPSKLESLSRISILFRDLKRNSLQGDIDQFGAKLEASIKLIDSSFCQACWSWCLWPHFFTELAGQDSEPEGNVIIFQVWAWGDDPPETYTNMARAYQNLRTALEQTH